MKKMGEEISNFECEPNESKSKLVMKMKFNKLSESSIITLKNKYKKQICVTLDLTNCNKVELDEDRSLIQKFIKSKQTEQFGSILGLCPDEFEKVKVKVKFQEEEEKKDE
jgi:hypothetical protein